MCLKKLIPVFSWKSLFGFLSIGLFVLSWFVISTVQIDSLVGGIILICSLVLLSLVPLGIFFVDWYKRYKLRKNALAVDENVVYGILDDKLWTNNQKYQAEILAQELSEKGICSQVEEDIYSHLNVLPVMENCLYVYFCHPATIKIKGHLVRGKQQNDKAWVEFYSGDKQKITIALVKHEIAHKLLNNSTSIPYSQQDKTIAKLGY